VIAKPNKEANPVPLWKIMVIEPKILTSRDFGNNRHTQAKKILPATCFNFLTPPQGPRTAGRTVFGYDNSRPLILLVRRIRR
jgi:hypothetical protein